MLRRALLLVAIVCVGLVPAVTLPGPVATAASTFTSTCPGRPSAGCVEERSTSMGGRAAAPSVLRELQMNLCDSGVADCYTHGRAPVEAAGLISRYQPSVVTVNEICAADVVGATAPIPLAMRQIGRQLGDPTVFALFTPAVNRYTGQPYRCADGDLYGIGIVGRGATPGTVRHHVYRNQLTSSDEERVAVCTESGGHGICTTHLESDRKSVAISQCHELMGYVGAGPLIVAGDFNLADVHGCVPPGWTLAGDGAVQHVIATGMDIASIQTVHMGYTDHPALIVDLRLRS